MNTNPLEIPDRWTRTEDDDREMRAVGRISPDLHKDVARIMLEDNENWQSLIEGFLVSYALSHKHLLPSHIEKKVDAQIRENKELARQALESREPDLSTQSISDLTLEQLANLSKSQINQLSEEQYDKYLSRKESVEHA